MGAPAGKYRVKVNDFEFFYDDEAAGKMDVIRKSPGQYNLINGNRSVNATILDSDLHGKHQLIEIHGKTFRVEIGDELDQMLDKMGYNKSTGMVVKNIQAPMPGMVLEVSVREGQVVQEGDRILILEAMKMENSILIHSTATIKKVLVKPGEPVEKGQVLVELE